MLNVISIDFTFYSIFLQLRFLYFRLISFLCHTCNWISSVFSLSLSRSFFLFMLFVNSYFSGDAINNNNDEAFLLLDPSRSLICRVITLLWLILSGINDSRLEKKRERKNRVKPKKKDFFSFVQENDKRFLMDHIYIYIYVKSLWKENALTLKVTKKCSKIDRCL